jgi:hypothetical protein
VKPKEYIYRRMAPLAVLSVAAGLAINTIVGRHHKSSQYAESGAYTFQDTSVPSDSRNIEDWPTGVLITTRDVPSCASGEQFGYGPVSDFEPSHVSKPLDPERIGKAVVGIGHDSQVVYVRYTSNSDDPACKLPPKIDFSGPVPIDVVESLGAVDPFDSSEG